MTPSSGTSTTTRVVGGFTIPAQTRAKPVSQPVVVTNADVSPCCEGYCGTLVPLVANGSYNAPGGDGKTHISFNLSASPVCGISVARVLRGDLNGLVGRDDLAMLNPRAGSMRLRIEVSNPSPLRPPTNQLVPIVARP